MFYRVFIDVFYRQDTLSGHPDPPWGRPDPPLGQPDPPLGYPGHPRGGPDAPWKCLETSGKS